MLGICPTCGSIDNEESTVKTYVFNTKDCGDVHVTNVPQQSCINCGESLALDYAGAKQVEEYVKTIIQDLINQLPICEFITKSKALELANVEVDANSVLRFDRFVHRTWSAGRWMYHRPSVEAYRDTEDGRISLRGKP